MKRLLATGTALALMLAVTPVMAEPEQPGFHAFTAMAVGQSEALATMSDEELAAVEGGQVSFCLVCLNIAPIIQANTALAVQALGVAQALAQNNQVDAGQILGQFGQ